MSVRRHRRWSWWAARGAVAMAALAVLALAVTVAFTQRALDGAAEVVVRGEGDALASALVVDLWQGEWPPTARTLEPLLAKYEVRGLRYVALADRKDHAVLVQAGSALIARPFDVPGEVTRQGRRVRVVALIPPPWETRATGALPVNSTEPATAFAPPANRPYLVIELEPPINERLQQDLRRISVVAACCAMVLLVLALAWSRTSGLLTAVERKAESDRRLVELGRASSVIAHELRNPLAALKGHAQLLVEDLEGASRSKAGRVVEGAERLERLTSVLLDFVRDRPLDLRTITPAELIERALVGLPKQRVQVELARAPAKLHVDAERIALALRNLLQNAIQATEDDAQSVEVGVDGGVIEVRDHGAGLPRGSQANIFDPFVTTKARGTGLGLSIARRIAEQHEGTLTAETHAEGGAVFRLVLPLRPERARPA